MLSISQLHTDKLGAAATDGNGCTCLPENWHQLSFKIEDDGL